MARRLLVLLAALLTLLAATPTSALVGVAADPATGAQNCARAFLSTAPDHARGVGSESPCSRPGFVSPSARTALGCCVAPKDARGIPRLAGGAPKPEEIIRPGGQLIGQPGRRAGIREVDDARAVDDLFEQIRIHGTPTKSRYPGEGFDLPGGGFVGRRVSTKHGPTLDLNLPGVDDIFKVHVRR